MEENEQYEGDQAEPQANGESLTHENVGAYSIPREGQQENGIDYLPLTDHSADRSNSSIP